MAAGTAHGLVVYDCLQNIIITTKCTLNAQGNLTLFIIIEIGYSNVYVKGMNPYLINC